MGLEQVENLKNFIHFSDIVSGLLIVYYLSQQNTVDWVTSTTSIYFLLFWMLEIRGQGTSMVGFQ